MKKTPKGIIIVLHSGMINIPEETCISVLPKAWQSLPRELVKIKYSEVFDLKKLYNINFAQFALEHRRQFESEILPLLNKKPDYKIVYFGFAPIALTVDLGQLFHNFRDIEIFQLHHVTKEWYQEAKPTVKGKNDLKIEGLPSENQKGIDSVLIRMSVSHSVKAEETNEILTNAAEVDIKFPKTDEDVINSKKKLNEVGLAIKKVLDTLAKNRSKINTIHLFASVPCGVAFLVGTKISPTIHGFVQTYQYSSTKKPCYVKAILVKGEVNAGRKITPKEKKVAAERRKLANEELITPVRNYLAVNRDMSLGRSWFQGIIPTIDKGVMNEEFWTNLPALYETSLGEDAFDFDSETVNDGFYWRNNKWFVDDNFFISLGKRLKNELDIKLAIRLFLFHEALHYKKHKLTSEKSNNIGSFAKVLETADYQADVYGLINEYGYHTKTFGVISDPKQFFLNAIRVATETMWSFDDAGIDLEQIQIRRLNRYMIWYWQYARIERDGKDINDIIKILEEKPIIELNGLKTKEENNRFFFVLEKRKDQPLELGLFRNNEVIRNGDATNLPIETLVKGIREMKGDMILSVMRSFVI